MASKMVVRVSVDQYTSPHDLNAEIDPRRQLLSSINDCLIPRHRLGFYRLAVAEPSDVRPVGCDWVELQF